MIIILRTKFVNRKPLRKRNNTNERIIKNEENVIINRIGPKAFGRRKSDIFEIMRETERERGGTVIIQKLMRENSNNSDSSPVSKKYMGNSQFLIQQIKKTQ